jgi:hypothetical protein
MAYGVYGAITPPQRGHLPARRSSGPFGKPITPDLVINYRDGIGRTS